MKEILEIALSGFWSFVGTMILLSMVLQLPFKCWNRWLRSKNIRAHGWPPPHCDADGEFPEKEEKED